MNPNFCPFLASNYKNYKPGYPGFESKNSPRQKSGRVNSLINCTPTLKKFEDLTNKPQVDTNSLPRNVRKAMEKFNEDGFIQLDVDKALMLANAQGNLNMQIGN